MMVTIANHRYPHDPEYGFLYDPTLAQGIFKIKGGGRQEDGMLREEEEEEGSMDETVGVAVGVGGNTRGMVDNDKHGGGKKGVKRDEEEEDDNDNDGHNTPGKAQQHKKQKEQKHDQQQQRQQQHEKQQHQHYKQQHYKQQRIKVNVQLEVMGGPAVQAAPPLHAVLFRYAVQCAMYVHAVLCMCMR